MGSTPSRTVDTWLHREHETWLERARVAFDHVDGFVAVHPDAVAQAMRELRPEAGARDDRARRSVDVLRTHTGKGGRDRRTLCIMHEIVERHETCGGAAIARTRF